MALPNLLVLLRRRLWSETKATFEARTRFSSQTRYRNFNLFPFQALLQSLKQLQLYNPFGYTFRTDLLVAEYPCYETLPLIGRENFHFSQSLLTLRSALLIASLSLTTKASTQINTFFYSVHPSYFYGSTGGVLVTGFSAIHFQGTQLWRVSCYTLLSGWRLPSPPSRCQ